jgi:hypothetical protein
MNRLIVVDCYVFGPVGCGDDTLGPVLIKIVGGNVRIVHVNGGHRQPRDSQSHIAWIRNGMQSPRKNTLIIHKQ